MAKYVQSPRAAKVDPARTFFVGVTDLKLLLIIIIEIYWKNEYKLNESQFIFKNRNLKYLKIPYSNYIHDSKIFEFSF